MRASVQGDRRLAAVVAGVVLVVVLAHPARFSVATDSDAIRAEDVPSELASFARNSTPGVSCPPVDMSLLRRQPHSSHTALASDISLSAAAVASALDVSVGGRWSPRACVATLTSVVIVPYRDRAEQLEVFLRRLHPFVQAQNVSYRVVVVEQSDDGRAFNRGKLFNVGFNEIVKRDGGFDCAIFHDVDLIPLDARNVYACVSAPRHMSVSVDTFRFLLPYDGLFGGAVAVPARVFRAVNGFSNAFFGWGGEDDDFSLNRLLMNGYDIARFDSTVSRYLMLPHAKQPNERSNEERLRNGALDAATEGLSNLEYEVMDYVELPLYTKITVLL